MAEKKAPASSRTDDVGHSEVQSAFDEANERGYFGTVPDERPNEDYTLAGSVRRAKEERA